MLLPTKDLCAQIKRAFDDLTHYCSSVVSTVDLGEGVDTNVQHARLRDKPDVIVTTPMRLASYLEAKLIDLTQFETLVIDEAGVNFLTFRKPRANLTIYFVDLIVTYGYQKDLRSIVAWLPKVYQSFLMSATLEGAKNYSSFLHTPVILQLKEPTASSLQEACVQCSERDKFLIVYSLILMMLVPMKVLLFVNSIEQCLRLKMFFDSFSINTLMLNSESPADLRKRTLFLFAGSPKQQILIATDELIDGIASSLHLYNLHCLNVYF